MNTNDFSTDIIFILSIIILFLVCTIIYYIISFQITKKKIVDVSTNVSTDVSSSDQVVASSEKIVPLVTELKFGDKVMPKPSCPFGQIYSDIAFKCICPISSHALINNKCMEVKCYDGYITKRSGVNADGNYIICINQNGNEKLILTNNLQPV